MRLIRSIVTTVGKCISFVALLIAFVIAKVLYWAIMGVKFLMLILIEYYR